MSTSIDLAGKVALVTGGSRGIGAACCRALSRAGASVILGYRADRAAAEAVCRSIHEEGGATRSLGGDLSRRDEAELLVEEATSGLGRLDILVNNAGIWKGAPIEEMSDQEWREMLEVNLTGCFHVTRAAVAALRQSRGSVVNVSSTAGQRGEADHSHYAATKGALIAWTKSLAAELAPEVRVNAVAPGWIATDMTREALSGPEAASIRRAIPLGREGIPEEIAGPVLFLVSDLASHITGEVLNINGGSVLCG
jgi:3-oxoacyl-[acyl-carrier protein] reductase